MERLGIFFSLSVPRNRSIKQLHINEMAFAQLFDYLNCICDDEFVLVYLGCNQVSTQYDV